MFPSEFEMEMQFHGHFGGCIHFHSECEEQDLLGRHISKTRKLEYVRCLGETAEILQLGG